MKKTKKLFALLIAGVMALSLNAAVLADDTSEIEGQGKTVVTNLKATLVTLPTSVALNFTLDPQGLESATYTSGKIDVSALVPNANIITSNKAGALVVNRSSYPIVVTVSAKATGNAVAVADSTALNANTNNNVLLWVNSSAATTNITTSTTNFAGTVKAIDALNATDKNAFFALKRAEYEVTQAGTDPNYTYSIALKASENGDGTKIQVGGQINLNADWSDYAKPVSPKTVGIAVKFSFAEGTGDAVDFTTAGNYVSGAYGLINTDVVTVTPPAPTRGFTGSSSSSIVSGNWASNIPFEFGGLTISSVTLSPSTPLASGTNYTTTSNSISFKIGSKGVHTIIVKLSDNSTYNYTLTVN